MAIKCEECLRGYADFIDNEIPNDEHNYCPSCGYCMWHLDPHTDK